MTIVDCCGCAVCNDRLRVLLSHACQTRRKKRRQMRRKQVVDVLAVAVEVEVEVEDDLVVENKQSMILNNKNRIKFYF